MEKKYTIIGIILIILILTPNVFAMVEFPHRFCGDVLIDGEPAPNGTLVYAKIVGKTVLANIQNPVQTVNGSYGKSSLALLVQGDNLQGETIEFYINDIKTNKTFIFEYGGGTDCVDLLITTSTPPPYEEEDPEEPAPNIPINLGGSMGGSILINTSNQEINNTEISANESINLVQEENESFNYENQSFSKELTLNEILNINISGIIYSLFIEEINDSWIYINISENEMIQLFIGESKEVIFNNQTVIITLESIAFESATINFETLASNEDNESSLITAQVIAKGLEEQKYNNVDAVITASLIFAGIMTLIGAVKKH